MRLKSTGLLLLVVCLIMSGCSKKFKLAAGDEKISSPWSFSRNDIQATARIDSDFDGNLNLKWEKKVSEAPVGPLSIGAGKLIYCGTKRRIYFYDLKSGKYLGRYKAKRSVQTGVVVLDSLAYFGVGPARNEFVCVNLLNRKTIWSLPLKDITGAPIIIDNGLYVGSASGNVYCLDRSTGDILWRDTVGYRTVAGPSSDGSMVYFPFDNGSFGGYTALTGKRSFESELGQPLMAKPVVDDKIYLTGTEGGLFALDKRTGEILWQTAFSHPIWTSPAVDDNRLFFGDNGGNFRAVDKNDGTILWDMITNGVIVSSPIVVGDFVLFASLDRHLYCLDKDSGELVSEREFKKGIRFPAVSDGRVICVASHDGTIQCFGD